MGDGRNERENKSFTKRVGATTYVVNVHFSETDSATLEENSVKSAIICMRNRTI